MKYTASTFCQVVHAMDAKSYTAASTSTTTPIDTKGFSEALVILNVGVAAANAELDAWVMESVSTTAASFAHIAGSSFTQATPTAATKASQVIRLDLSKRKRYLRVKFKADGSNACLGSADVVLLGAKTLPVTASATVKATL